MNNIWNFDITSNEEIINTIKLTDKNLFKKQIGNRESVTILPVKREPVTKNNAILEAKKHPKLNKLFPELHEHK